MNIGKWALESSKLIWFLCAILIIGGAGSYYSMSKLEDPKVTVKQAMVVTTCPGASAYEVELQVSTPIERAIRTMKNVDNVQSQSSANLSIITVNLSTTVSDSEIEQQWDILRRKVADVQRSLPSSAQQSIVMDSYGDVYGMFYALTSDGFSNEELTKYAKLIQRRVIDIEGISDVQLYGVFAPTIEVEIYEDRIANLGVSPIEVIQTIEGQNKMIYSGYYDSGNRMVRVSVEDKYCDISDIENLIIQGHQSDQMRLRDVAKISRSYADPIRNALYYDNQPAIGISISALDGTDITKLGVKVDQLLEELSATQLPVGVEYEKVFFQPERVEDAITLFAINLLESIAIVVIVLMFAMGFRSGVLLGVTLGITVLGSLLFLNLFDGTLQRVSLASFILAMGMLVDNAIVVVDGILIDSKRSGLNTQTLTSIGQKTAMPLLGATMIAILAFFPIFLSPDTAGIYVHDLFVVLAVSLLLSWILSLTLVPLLAKRMFQGRVEGGEEPRYDSRFYQMLRSTLVFGLNHRVSVVVIAVVSLALSGWLYTFLPQSFFPDMSYDQLYIEYKLPEGHSSTQTESDIREISNYLLDREDVKHVTTSVGGTPSRYNLVRSIATPSLAYGELIVDFDSNQALVEAIPNLQSYLTENYPQAYVRVKRYNLMYNKYPIEAVFMGPDPEVLRELTHEAQRIMESNDKVMLITSDWEQKVPELIIEYDQQVARSIGLSRSDVGYSILASTDGMPINTIYDGDVAQQLIIKCVNREGGQIDTLQSAPIFPLIPSIHGLDRDLITKVSTGKLSLEQIIESMLDTTPLDRTMTDLSVEWSDPLVMHYNGQRSMRAQANPVNGVGAEDARIEIKDQIESIPLPDGYSMMWLGEYDAKSKSMKYLFANLPLAIILMIAILILLFKDYTKPLIILLCVPLLLVGVILGVWVAGKAFGFVAICGVLGLIGMMIKSGIVLMDQISLEIESGKDPYTALLDSSASRFRPVMMASLTTILGMIPLLPDAMFGSLAATIMGGLLVGTIIILIFIPILYSLLFGVGKKC